MFGNKVIQTVEDLGYGHKLVTFDRCGILGCKTIEQYKIMPTANRQQPTINIGSLGVDIQRPYSAATIGDEDEIEMSFDEYKAQKDSRRKKLMNDKTIHFTPLQGLQNLMSGTWTPSRWGAL